MSSHSKQGAAGYPQEASAVSGSSAESAAASASRPAVPCAFAGFPNSTTLALAEEKNEASNGSKEGHDETKAGAAATEWFTLGYHPDGHSDTVGLLSLGRNMGKCFFENFLKKAESA